MPFVIVVLFDCALRTDTCIVDQHVQAVQSLYAGGDRSADGVSVRHVPNLVDEACVFLGRDVNNSYCGAVPLHQLCGREPDPRGAAGHKHAYALKWNSTCPPDRFGPYVVGDGEDAG